MSEALGTPAELLLTDSWDSCQVSDNKASKKFINIIEATLQKVRCEHLLSFNKVANTWTRQVCVHLNNTGLYWILLTKEKQITDLVVMT